MQSQFKSTIFIIHLSLILLLPTTGHSFMKQRLIRPFSAKIMNRKWVTLGSSRSKSLHKLIQILQLSSTGRTLYDLVVYKVRAEKRKLEDVFVSGATSFTDTTLIRNFSVEDPTYMEVHDRSIIYINSDLKVSDAILDLAHEMTHFVFRKNFNPYENYFSLTAFIKNTIEGDGGEVDAFLNECKVHKELFGNTQNYELCNEFYDSYLGKFHKDFITKRFYQVGPYLKDMKKILYGENHNLGIFPYLNRKKIKFISSAYGVPYPLAAAKEYYSVLKKSCTNEQKRLAYLKNEYDQKGYDSYIHQLETKIYHKCNTSQFKSS